MSFDTPAIYVESDTIPCTNDRSGDVRGDVILPLRVVPQPVPKLHDAGDCGPCVLAGLLGTTPKDVYDRQGKVAPLSWWEMRQMLYDCKSEGLFDRIVTNPPSWPQEAISSIACWGCPSTLQSLAWFEYIRMALDAGYYAIALVDFEKGGLHGHGPNHWVLICGARMVYPASGSGAIKQEVLVSCSNAATPDEEWVEVRDLLRYRGGFNALLARPTPRPV